MDPEEGTSWGFPADVFVEILLRLPLNSRRRFRLVCRLWRDVIDDRTATDLRNRAKTLIVTDHSAYVLDDLSIGVHRRLWTSDTACDYVDMSIVGTCNGLVCLCDDRVPGGAITLANPVTGEALAVPSLPRPPSCVAGAKSHYFSRAWHQAYDFAYHPTTGRYKVVHVPCRFNQFWDFHTMQVFTLGEASWRDVVITVPDARCDLDAGIVSVNGTMYWTTVEGVGKLMSFDLEDERVTPISSPPSVPSRFGSWLLTEVHGRLGIAVGHILPSLDNTEVWVMEGARGQRQRWSCWYSLQVSRSGHQFLTRPHFAHGDEHVLTWEYSWLDRIYVWHKHRPKDDTTKARRGVVEISERNQGTVVAIISRGSTRNYQTFAYVETREPLSVYRTSD